MPNQIMYGRSNGGTGDPLAVAVDTNHNLVISGTVTTGAGTQPVSGTVSVSGTVPVSGTVGVSGTVPVSGTVSLSGGTVTSVSSLGGTVEQKPYTAISTGELAVGTAAGGTTTASIPCHYVRWRARNSNAGTVFMGGGTGVTTPDGTTDTTTGFGGFIAGDDSGWIPADNVNRFYWISTGTANAVTYMALN